MKKLLFILLLPIFSCDNIAQKSYGVRRDNKVELKKAAEAAFNNADGNFDIIMYGDTAEILGDNIAYKYAKELPGNKSIKMIELESGVWYWGLPIGYRIVINDYDWVVIKDTAFQLQGNDLFKFYNIPKMLNLEKLGVVKRKYSYEQLHHIADSVIKENDSLKIVIDKCPVNVIEGMENSNYAIDSNIFYDNNQPFIVDSSVKFKKRKWLIDVPPLPKQADTFIVDGVIYVLRKTE